MDIATNSKSTTGQNAAVEVAPDGIFSLAGRFADDPTLQGICDEAYRERDEERALVVEPRDVDTQTAKLRRSGTL